MFVTHAGMNAAMEAVYDGVPCLHSPQMPEQVVKADRVVELGLGRRPGNLIAGALRRAVDDIASSAEVAANRQHVRVETSRGGGAIGGADAIEQYIL